MKLRTAALLLALAALASPRVMLAQGHQSAEGSAALASASSEDKALPSAPLRFVAIAPCRLADTRGNGFSGAFGPPSLVASSTRDFPVAGHCGVSATAQAASLNVTVVSPDRPGFIGIWPGGDPQPNPLVSSLNYVTGQVVPNAVVAPLGSSGAMTVLTVGKTDLLLDVNGYYEALVPVESLNGLNGNVTVQAGANVSITPSGNTLTIAATGGSGGILPTGAFGQTLRSNGSAWLASSALTNDGTNVGVSGNLLLPDTGAGGATGVLFLGADRFLHNYGLAADAANTFVGQLAGNFTMGGSGSQGKYNTAIGNQSLLFNTTGSSNTALGRQSLFSNAAGSGNTANGINSLYSNTTGSDNTAVGNQSLFFNVSGSYNTASGALSLISNTTGSFNTATGDESLYSNTTGFSNTANGSYSLYSNITGSHNTATGYASLGQNTTGDSNSAFGLQGLYLNTTGLYNTASGYFAGYSNTTGSNNTFLGYSTDAAAGDLSNATAVGNRAVVDASNHVRIGNNAVTQIGGAVGWSNLSDARHKENIRDLELGLDFVRALRPVAYTLAQGDTRSDMGFLAQDVEALLGGGYSVLGIGGDADRTLSLRYTDLIAPMVKAMQEQDATIKAQQVQMADQTKTIRRQQDRVDALERAVQGLLDRIADRSR